MVTKSQTVWQTDWPAQLSIQASLNRWGENSKEIKISSLPVKGRSVRFYDYFHYQNSRPMILSLEMRQINNDINFILISVSVIIWRSISLFIDISDNKSSRAPPTPLNTDTKSAVVSSLMTKWLSGSLLCRV